ncbi:hypothetical protein MBLNU459_g3357t1 [Dothideomycetes sp. NU459]
MAEPSRVDGAGEIMTENKPTDAEAAVNTAAEEATKKCASCGKLEEDPEKPLKACQKCHSILYCSRDCQKTDFKHHKKTCASSAQIHAQKNEPKIQVTRAPPKQSGSSRGLQKWQFDT